ncbi:MAG: hypothetical protein OQL20_00085 [Sedimenticola sp.]|nr:hypothetical protein [Sedimenticola sp.]
MPLGKALVEKERQVDRLFAQGVINDNDLRRLLMEIGDVQARIRYVHLRTHLAQKVLLTPEQVTHYDQLRGYQPGAESSHSHTHH